MAEGRLRLALTRAAFVMEDVADCVYVEASSYEERECPPAYRELVRRLRKAAKAARGAATPKPSHARPMPDVAGEADRG